MKINIAFAALLSGLILSGCASERVVSKAYYQDRIEAPRPVKKVPLKKTLPPDLNSLAYIDIGDLRS